ncbi:hypothetical protein EV1_004517 [Malus domestica]
MVSMAVTGAIIGAAIGGWMNNALGRKKSILAAYFVFFTGAIEMTVAPALWGGTGMGTPSTMTRRTRSSAWEGTASRSAAWRSAVALAR